MSLVERRFDAVYRNALLVPYNQESKFVIMSDCHRGQGNAGDNFLGNQNLFFGALNHYYKKGFTYIELGDGDELWENRRMKPIIDTHSNVFWMMQKFHRENRFYMMSGNHDIVKNRKDFAEKNLAAYYNPAKKKYVPLFPDLSIHEGIILESTEHKGRIFLIHGHQGGLLNETFWPIARILARYLWRTLELVGFLDPTGPGREHRDLEKYEKKYNAYAAKNKQIMILGHTHRPVFPQPQKGFYFNDGSCIHPRCITGLEIEHNEISLIKWSTRTREDGTLYVGREVLEEPVQIEKYYA